MSSLNDITFEIARWLSKNDLPTEGVRLVIEFPTSREAHKAEQCIRAEVEPTLATLSPGVVVIETMNGIGMAFRGRTS